MNRSMVAIVVVGAVVIVGGAVVLAHALGGGGPTSRVVLPPGCVRPAGGFLVVAAYDGFNDSVDHGVPANAWPVINVRQGQNVTITVCNADSQPHGFQVAHYYDSRTVALDSGQVITVTFTAEQPGSYKIYCSILCTVHWAMVSGELVVS